MADAQCTDFATGLLRPIGITQSKKGNLLVSESGAPGQDAPNTGRISIVNPAGVRRTLVEGLPAGFSFEGGANSGAVGLVIRDRTLYLGIGVGDTVLAGPSQGTTRVNPAPSSPLFSSVLAFEFSAAVEQNTQGFTMTVADHHTLAHGSGPVTLTNAAGETLKVEMIVNFPDSTPDPRPNFAENVRNVNPFGLAAVGNSLYVTDGGQNLIWRVDLSRALVFGADAVRDHSEPAVQSQPAASKHGRADPRSRADRHQIFGGSPAGHALPRLPLPGGNFDSHARRSAYR